MKKRRKIPLYILEKIVSARAVLESDNLLLLNLTKEEYAKQKLDSVLKWAGSEWYLRKQWGKYAIKKGKVKKDNSV